MELKKSDSMSDILSSLKDKTVDIVLSNGKSYNGKIIDIGHHIVSLEQRGNRSFFDAIIKIEDISAVEVQARGL